MDWTDPFTLTVALPCPWAWLCSFPGQPVCVLDSHSQGPFSAAPALGLGLEAALPRQAGLQDRLLLTVHPLRLCPGSSTVPFSFPTCASCTRSPHLECLPWIPTCPDPPVLRGPGPGCFLHEPRLCPPAPARPLSLDFSPSPSSPIPSSVPPARTVGTPCITTSPAEDMALG